jgi:hypothetical protein
MLKGGWMNSEWGSEGDGSITGAGAARGASGGLRVIGDGVELGSNVPLGVYGRGLNDWAAGVKKLSSGVIDVRRRLRGLGIALVDAVPLKDKEVVRRERVSDIADEKNG